jgi:bifunctional non-homologous end joining protein LigD
MARRDPAGVRLLTRNGIDWSGSFPLIVQAAEALKARSCLIDGEAIAYDDDGLASFELLRGRRHDRVVALCAFDLIELDGRDLRSTPLEERKRALARLIGKPRPGIMLNATFEEAGDIVFKHSCALGCEGMVSKRLGSRYRSGHLRDWIKSKKPAAPRSGWRGAIDGERARRSLAIVSALCVAANKLQLSPDSFQLGKRNEAD